MLKLIKEKESSAISYVVLLCSSWHVHQILTYKNIPMRIFYIFQAILLAHATGVMFRRASACAAREVIVLSTSIRFKAWSAKTCSPEIRRWQPI